MKMKLLPKIVLGLIAAGIIGWTGFKVYEITQRQKVGQASVIEDTENQINKKAIEKREEERTPLQEANEATTQAVEASKSPNVSQSRGMKFLLKEGQ